MSGNYDYPPASNRPSRGSASNVTTQLQNLRNLLESERTRERTGSTTARALETLNQEIEHLRSDRARHQSTYEEARAAVDRQLQHLQADFATRRAGRARRRTQDREREQNPSRTGSTSGNMDSEQDTSTTNRVRRRGLRPSETLARIRDNRANRTAGMDVEGLSGLQQAAARIREADAAIVDSGRVINSSLVQEIPRADSPSGLNSPTIPEVYPIDWDWESTPLMQDPGNSSSATRWRAKRRKLDADDNREGLRGFSYGHHGQVVPGALKMEIASCDGGTYYDEDNGESSWPGNVLLNDSSVYCTKRGRCNLILRHRGETPFCLKKIVIKAPKKGFDAAHSIQEGMVFVSMSSDELLERTAQYQIHYPPQRQRCRRSRRQYTQPSQEYMNAYRSPLQTLDRSAFADSESHPDLDAEFFRAVTTGVSESRSYRTSRNGPNPEPQFRVITNHDDNSDNGRDENQENDDDFPSATEIERMDMEQDDEELFCPEDEDQGSEDDEMTAFNRGRLDMRRQIRAYRSQNSLDRNRLDTPSRIEPMGPSSRGNSTRPGPDAAQPEVMKPHARFFIEREKSMVSIKFDPPPSGRFILIKLWSPYSGGNIDIQSIMVHGFAGPRFFPGLEFR